MDRARALFAVCIVVAMGLSSALTALAPPVPITPPPDYHVEEGIWIKDHASPATSWNQYTSVASCLNLSSSTSTLDIAYVIRSPNPDLTLAVTFALYRNSDTRERFLDNGTLLTRARMKGGAMGMETDEPVRPFWVSSLTKTEPERFEGHWYYLVLTTFDAAGHSGVYQLRVNVSGISGGSSWDEPTGNPRVPWIFFRVPSGAETSVSASKPGPLRAACLCNVVGSGFPTNGSDPYPCEIFIDSVSWLNGSCYGGRFVRRNVQIWRWLEPGVHILRTVCAETEAFAEFQTHQWDAELEVTPNATVPGGRAICIVGRGFPVNESYSIYVGEISVNSTPILSGAISAFGNFSACYQFPRNSPLGPQEITATAPQVSGPPSATAVVVLDPWSVNLTVTPLKFRQGGWLDINGSDYPSGCIFEISVDNVRIYQGVADENGTFYHRAYTLDPLFCPGLHIISANATDYAGSACGRVEIQVLQYDAMISVHPATTHPGTFVTIDGEGFPPNDFIHIRLDGHLLSQLVSTSNGSFHVICSLPSNCSLGPHALTAIAPRFGGPPCGKATLDLVQWPLQVTLDPAAPHPGGWIRIAGRGLPPQATYEVRLNGSLILNATTGLGGEFDRAPSLPLDISLGTGLLDLVVPGYTGPPKASFMLQIVDWSPSIQLLPTSPRPGEALQVLGRGYPRNSPYAISLDGALGCEGTSLADGTFGVYILLRSNLSIGTHQLNITFAFPGFPPTAVDFPVEPWSLSLSVSPQSGPRGTAVNLQVEGCPPLCQASILWDGNEVKRGNCTIWGTLAESMVLDFQADETYHTIVVRCEGDWAEPPEAYAYFWFGSLVPTISISACDDEGTPRSTFFVGETVYVKGIGLPRFVDAWLYLLNGSQPSGQQEAVVVHTDSLGCFAVKILDSAPLRGEFGLWLDVNRNRHFDANDVWLQPAFMCRPRPQLAIARFEPSKALVTQGETASMLITVQNRGLETDDALIHVLYGSLEIATLQVSSLAAGSERSISVDWDTASTAPGRSALVAKIDPAPGEIEILDNEFDFGPFTIRPAPDISVLSLEPSTRRAKAGSVITFSAAVRNSGGGFETFELQVLWGEEVVASRTLKLPAGATVMEELEWNTIDVKPGERRIRLRTAPIPYEKNPSDNDLVSGTIAILPPNTPPQPRPGEEYRGICGIPLKFDASASTDDEGVVTFVWDFGDGSSGTGMVATHTYAKAGRYLVQLSVTDSEGAASSASTIANVFEPSEVKVWSADASGRAKNQFYLSEEVYATVCSPAPYNASLYIVIRESLQEGQALEDVSGAPECLVMAGNVTVLAWGGGLCEGRYEIVLDLNANKRFEPMFDPECSFLVVPQNGLGVAFVLALVLLTRAWARVGSGVRR